MKGELLQAAGLVAVIFGLVVECMYGAHVGFIFVTAGSLGFAIGTKLKGR